MPCSMKDSSDPLVMFVYCTCYHHWFAALLLVVHCESPPLSLINQHCMVIMLPRHWFWSGVVCSCTVAVILVGWLGGVLPLGLAVSLMWAVVSVVEEMLCANSKVRLLAHDDLTWKLLTTCPMQFHMILYGILVSLFEPWTPHRIIR